jgi:hypothetical protein
MKIINLTNKSTLQINDSCYVEKVQADQDSIVMSCFKLFGNREDYRLKDMLEDRHR